MASSDIPKPPGTITLSIAASIASHALALALPIALLQTYDRILPNETYSTTIVLAAGVVIAFVLEAILRYVRSLLFAYVGSSFETKMTVRVLNRVMRADNKALHQLSIPDLSNAISATEEVRDFWSGNAAVALHELPFALIYIALIAYLGSWLALIPLGFTVLALLAALIIARSVEDAQRDANAAHLQSQKLSWGIFMGIVEAKAMAAETLLTKRYRDATASFMKADARVEGRMSLITANGNLMAQLSTISTVTAGASMVIAGNLTMGGLAACTLLAGRSIGPTMEAFSYLSRHTQRRQAEDKINKILSLPPAPVWVRDATSEKRPFAGGTIVLSGQALHTHGGSVSIAQGTFVHVDVPNSPVGTMTLRTVARLEDSLNLSVTFDDLPVSAYDPRSFRRGVTNASSRGELIEGSLLDNLTLFSPNYESDVIQLSERLGLNTFVAGLHQGYMTPIGPGSSQIISPGIAARVGLIRALVRRPLILCLDNADGSLDINGVNRLCGVLKELKGHTTALIVSSSPALLQLTDMTIRVDRRMTAT